MFEYMSVSVPWMSSLKVQYRFLYLLRMRKALLLAKSSNCIRQFIPYLQDSRVDLSHIGDTHVFSIIICVSTHLSVTACMNSSIKASYSFPLILLCLSPIYRGSSSSVWTRNHSAHQSIRDNLALPFYVEFRSDYPCDSAQLPILYCNSRNLSVNYQVTTDAPAHKTLLQPSCNSVPVHTWLSVPTSSSTGRHCCGRTPPQAV